MNCPVIRNGVMLMMVSLALACSDEATKGNANADAAFPKLLEKAKAGDATAQMQVGGMYQTGDGVPVNLAESYMWLIVAKNNGMGSGVDPGLQLLETSGQLSAQQIQAAKSKAQKAFPPKSAPPK
ncbi:MAG: sel1 repeat family protein [Pedosphaera sp.]|nr:sel1 repeat family protein [Pedosphaera sp.]MSU43953.1 sel1 repeat family protein [Pedosphaera sp.]